MLIDLNAPIMQVDGVIFPSSKNLKMDFEYLTFKEVAVMSLQSLEPQRKISGSQKRERFRLAKILFSLNEYDFTEAELQLVKEVVGDNCSIPIAGAVLEMLTKI